MTKEVRDLTWHFNQARKKVRELGYKDLLDLDVKGSEEHKQLIREIYDSPQPLIKLKDLG